MKKFTNPLDNVRVAKPCPADWNGMFGSDRKRFCGDCKLNVYNLSDMTRAEAENFLLESEGRMCVRFYRRADGTMLTKDCPVGLAALKKRVSRALTAVFSMLAGLFGGLIAFGIFREAAPVRVMGQIPITYQGEPPVVAVQGDISEAPLAGGISNLNEVKGKITAQNGSRK